MEKVSSVCGFRVVGLSVNQNKTGGFIILWGDEMAVGGDDNPFHPFIFLDFPQGFFQLQSSVSMALVLLPDSVVAYLDILGHVPGIPGHKPDGFSVQAGHQAALVGNFRIVVKETVRLFPVRIPDLPVPFVE
jgi:hypothetical protein